MKTVLYFLVFLTCPLFVFSQSEKGFSQGIFKDIEFSLGIAIQPQDRRLFDYHQRKDIIDREKSSHDFEYAILFTKSIYNENIINFSTGIGYSLLVSKFSRPFDQNYFTGGSELLATFINNYNIHKLKLINSLKLNVINSDKNKISIILPISLSFAINKSIASGNWHESRWTFEFSNFEIYSGLRYQHGKFSTGISYRVFNLQAIDPVIFGSFLFNSPNPPFLLKKTETLNLTKFMITAGYQF